MISNLACCLRDGWQKVGLQLYRLSGDFRGMSPIPLHVPLRTACKPKMYGVEFLGGGNSKLLHLKNKLVITHPPSVYLSLFVA